jgi:hypothetical protein
MTALYAEEKDRLLKRAIFLGTRNVRRLKIFQTIFNHAIALGHSLRNIRENLEIIYQDPPEPHLPSAHTLRLWEQGLALPEEIQGGVLVPLLQWYAKQAQELKEESLMVTLSSAMLTYLEMRILLDALVETKLVPEP